MVCGGRRIHILWQIPCVDEITVLGVGFLSFSHVLPLPRGVGSPELDWYDNSFVQQLFLTLCVTAQQDERRWNSVKDAFLKLGGNSPTLNSGGQTPMSRTVTTNWNRDIAPVHTCPRTARSYPVARPTAEQWLGPHGFFTVTQFDDISSSCIEGSPSTDNTKMLPTFLHFSLKYKVNVPATVQFSSGHWKWSLKYANLVSVRWVLKCCKAGVMELLADEKLKLSSSKWNAQRASKYYSRHFTSALLIPSCFSSSTPLRPVLAKKKNIW